MTEPRKKPSVLIAGFGELFSGYTTREVADFFLSFIFTTYKLVLKENDKIVCDSFLDEIISQLNQMKDGKNFYG